MVNLSFPRAIFVKAHVEAVNSAVLWVVFLEVRDGYFVCLQENDLQIPQSK